jgi:putative ABC transport system substrate-binding protein
MPDRAPLEIESSGLAVMPDHFIATHRVLTVSLAAWHRVPTICPSRYFATVSCLMPNGADPNDPYRGISSNVLKGSNPAYLPLPSPDKIELAINLNVTKVLGPTVSQIQLARTDEVTK